TDINHHSLHDALPICTGLSITKGITILGATTIDTSTALGTAKDQTIILDDMTSALVTPPQLINISLSPNQVFRMSGFTFRSGVGDRKSTRLNFSHVEI